LRQICDNLEETFNKTRNELSEKLSDSFSLNEQLGERVRELESDLDEALARDRRRLDLQSEAVAVALDKQKQIFDSEMDKITRSKMEENKKVNTDVLNQIETSNNFNKVEKNKYIIFICSSEILIMLSISCVWKRSKPTRRRSGQYFHLIDLA
jgi:hypothetical protein